MEIQVSRAIRGHAARKSRLCKITLNADLLRADYQAVAIGRAGPQHHAVVRIDGPVALGLDAHVAGFRLVPTAILWGQKSQFTPSEIGQRLTNLNPQAVRAFQVVEDTGLTPQLELPAVTIGLIQKFLPMLS